jgi:hypothetical protein
VPTASKLKLNFLHPRTSTNFSADVSPECTGAIALQGLQSPATGPFLDPEPQGRPYELVLARGSKMITSTQSFADAQCQTGDTIEIRQSGQGA